MATMTYRLEEINKHKGRDSCWIIVDDKVYDVTKYLDQHPGGDQEILNETGTDATKAFVEVGHSSDAKEILETLLIGYLHPDDIRAVESKEGKIPWAKITVVAVVPLAVTLMASFIFFNRK